MLELKIHSPVEEIFDPLFDEKQVRLFVKRDDMIHPFISGNKWRKLKYALQAARNENKSRLITFGGAYSNHLVATACAGAKFGFQTTGIVRGEPVNNPSLMLCKLFGMNLQFVSREAYKDKGKLSEEYGKSQEDAYFIPEGGAGEAAVRGCSELVEELPETYQHIFCAAGTGTTAAGILAGLKQRQLSSQLHVVPVLKNGGFLEAEIAKLVASETQQLQLHLDYHFGGYAKTTEQLLTFIKEFASKTGILLDQVYTGKMLFAIYDLVNQDHFAPGTKILAIHTGGLMGLLSQAEKI